MCSRIDVKHIDRKYHFVSGRCTHRPCAFNVIFVAGRYRQKYFRWISIICFNICIKTYVLGYPGLAISPSIESKSPPHSIGIGQIVESNHKTLEKLWQLFSPESSVEYVASKSNTKAKSLSFNSSRAMVNAFPSLTIVGGCLLDVTSANFGAFVDVPS